MMMGVFITEYRLLIVLFQILDLVRIVDGMMCSLIPLLDTRLCGPKINVYFTLTSQRCAPFQTEASFGSSRYRPKL